MSSKLRTGGFVKRKLEGRRDDEYGITSLRKSNLKDTVWGL